MKLTSICLWISLWVPAVFGAQSTYDPGQNTWTIQNGWVYAVFQLTPEGNFIAREVDEMLAGDRWLSAPRQPSTPIQFQAGGQIFDSRTLYRLEGQSVKPTVPAGVRQSIVLKDLNSTAELVFSVSVYDNQPVLRYNLTYRNLTPTTVFVDAVNLLPWTFDGDGKRFTALRVNQFSGEEDFESHQAALDADGSSFEVLSGAHGQQCGWLALHDSAARGLFAGWEFDGRSRAAVRHAGAEGFLDLSAAMQALHHPVEPGTAFVMPSAFLGVFHGDFDEAGYRTQRFVEAVLAKPAPDGRTFPYISWDSWAYEDQIDESTLRRNADVAASLGVELFIVDLGWARSIGDWYANPDKFPNGLAALSDYVHALGMKFGLHFALAEAHPDSPVLRDNPDWAASQNDEYHGAVSLCLSHAPAKEWLIQQGIRIIDDYKIDWILQDGENMVKTCTKSTHSHDPADSNYANAVDGLNAVVSAIQAARPNVNWENCENGGNMMTFNMVQRYVTSITNDASGSLASRRAVFGATYPFPPRFAERYMPDTDGLSPYATHSYRFGGPWVLMNRLIDLSPDQAGFLAQQVARYKRERELIAGGKVYHIQMPGANVTDAIQSYNPETGSAIAIVTRAQTDRPVYTFRPRGLVPDQRYVVWFEIDPSVYSMPGAQLMSTGVRVDLPIPYSSDVIHIDPQ